MAATKYRVAVAFSLRARAAFAAQSFRMQASTQTWFARFRAGTPEKKFRDGSRRMLQQARLTSASAELDPLLLQAEFFRQLQGKSAMGVLLEQSDVLISLTCAAGDLVMVHVELPVAVTQNAFLGVLDRARLPCSEPCAFSVAAFEPEGFFPVAGRSVQVFGTRRSLHASKHARVLLAKHGKPPQRALAKRVEGPKASPLQLRLQRLSRVVGSANPARLLTAEDLEDMRRLSCVGNVERFIGLLQNTQKKLGKKKAVKK